MKTFLMVLLSLMLLLPLDVHAEDSDIQLPQQTESQPPQQTESQPPQQTEPQPPQQTESQPPQQTETQPPQQTESTPPQQTEPQPSDHTHVWDVSYTVPATCLEEGATAYGCSACGAINVEVIPKSTTHTYDNVCDPHCNICDMSREVPHKTSISSVWSKNASGHWHACSACGAQEDFGKHFPGPAATEEKAQICLTCGYTLTAKLSHSHKYAAEWTSDDTGHWYACSGCGERKDFSAHSYEDPCDSDCDICGYQVATSHSYSGTWRSDAEGHWDICISCREESAPEPHIPGPDATGNQAQVCTVCGIVLVPALETTEHSHEGEGPWQKDAERHWKLCACGEETDANPHSWDEGETQEESTVLYTCKDCGAVRTDGTETGINPLVWVGVSLASLLGAAGIAAFLLISRKRTGGKYSR